MEDRWDPQFTLDIHHLVISYRTFDCRIERMTGCGGVRAEGWALIFTLDIHHLGVFYRI